MTPLNPPPDDIDRDAIHPDIADDADDGDEYELEPPDASVVSAEDRLAQETIAAAEQTIDIDELYREDERRLEIESIDEWISKFRFQFRVKHLLVATAIVAILLSLRPGTALLLGVLASVGGLLLYLAWKEKEHEAAMEEKRRRLYAQRRAQRAEREHAPDAEPGDVPDAAPVERTEIPLSEKLLSLCSPREALIASFTAAVVLGLLGITFGAAVMATCLGIIAVGGILVQAIGVDMPRMVVLCWWLLLVLYVVVSIILAIVGNV